MRACAAKSIISRLTLLLVVGLLLPMCSSEPTGPGDNIPAPTAVPQTPPDPTPPDLTVITVAEILSGNSPHEVTLAGELTGPTSDSDEWEFSDGTGSIVLDFPSSNIPAVGVPIYVFGTVASSEIDVAEWQPVPPLMAIPQTPPDPTPPPLTLTTVSDILSGNSPHEVILAGSLTGPTSDSDEWEFSDGTGSIVLDFPSSNIPVVGAPIYVHGTVASSEIDVIAWEPATDVTMPPPTVPVTPPDPTPPDLTVRTVAEILSGNVAGEVTLQGVLTEPTSDSDEWVFSDGTGSIVLDFPSSNIPALGTPIYIFGTVASSEIDVAEWQPVPELIAVPQTPPDPTPPSLALTPVSDILNGSVVAGEVMLAGELTGPTSDSDEWLFSDGTGEIVLDFPSSNIPAVGVTIYVFGTIASSEIDVAEWEPVLVAVPQ